MPGLVLMYRGTGCRSGRDCRAPRGEELSHHRDLLQAKRQVPAALAATRITASASTTERQVRAGDQRGELRRGVLRGLAGIGGGANWVLIPGDPGGESCHHDL